VYTLVIKPDLSYVISMDGRDRIRGDLKDDFRFVEPPTIKVGSMQHPSFSVLLADW
jgi:hypothetical protein